MSRRPTTCPYVGEPASTSITHSASGLPAFSVFRVTTYASCSRGASIANRADGKKVGSVCDCAIGLPRLPLPGSLAERIGCTTSLMESSLLLRNILCPLSLRLHPGETLITVMATQRPLSDGLVVKIA